MFDNSYLFISWNKARLNVFRLQKRIFKSIYIGDFIYALKLQKLLIISNSARLLAIRFVTQGNSASIVNYKDSNVSFDFLEKFKVSNLLLKSANNWNPGKCKETVLLDNLLGSSFNVKIWSIPDRCWQCLIKFILEPSFEAVFSPRNFTLNKLSSIYRMQQIILLNLSESSYAIQKRVLRVSFQKTILKFNSVSLLKKVLVPRSIKIGIFRFLKLGLSLDLDYKFSSINFLGYLLANILVSDIDFLSNNVRTGSECLVFLKPLENEFEFVQRLYKFLYSIGIDGVCS